MKSEKYMSTNTQRILIEKVRDSRDHESWKEFVEIYRPYIYKVIRRMSLSHEEAEDLCDDITIINKGKKIVEDKKFNLLSLFSKRIVDFELNEEINIFPDTLQKFIKSKNGKNLTIEYDKKKINLSEIIKEFNNSDILFSELKTHDEDLESIFLKVLSDSDKII